MAKKRAVREPEEQYDDTSLDAAGNRTTPFTADALRYLSDDRLRGLAARLDACAKKMDAEKVRVIHVGHIKTAQKGLSFIENLVTSAERALDSAINGSIEEQIERINRKQLGE